MARQLLDDTNRHQPAEWWAAQAQRYKDEAEAISRASDAREQVRASAQTTLLAEMRQSHDQAVLALKQSHLAEVVRLEKAHADELKKLQAEHAKVVAVLMDEPREVRELRERHARESAEVQERHWKEKRDYLESLRRTGEPD